MGSIRKLAFFAKKWEEFALVPKKTDFKAKRRCFSFRADVGFYQKVGSLTLCWNESRRKTLQFMYTKSHHSSRQYQGGGIFLRWGQSENSRFSLKWEEFALVPKKNGSQGKTPLLQFPRKATFSLRSRIADFMSE